MTYEEWRYSEACQLMNGIELQPTKWVTEEDMTDEEKEIHPVYKTIGGYLKTNDNQPAFQEWWSKLSEKEKEIIKGIPNFDAGKFKEITGIDVEATK
jgi:hypothetical protein